MKTAVVSGGTRGIGAALVRALLASGWNVAYSGTSRETIEKSFDDLRGKFPEDRYAGFPCEVSSEADIISLWEEAASTFGNVDIWVNNART